MPPNLNRPLWTVLSLPLMNRLRELIIMFDSSPVDQLQVMFPKIVHSVFGNDGDTVGWGLRTTTVENSPLHFQILYRFFGVCGPWMQLCHRLLADQWKYELDINQLPAKFVAMLQSRNKPMFYTDLFKFPPMLYHSHILLLNAFEFYVVHFVLHALEPLHSIDSISMQMLTVRSQTVYLKLVSEYLGNFLPLDPNARIEPGNFSGFVKVSHQHQQALRPMRQPRYLRIPGHFFGGAESPNTSGSGGNISAALTYDWRSESVLYFFVDIWLQYDIESEYHLPSIDFVRGVRTLVEQIHFFANAVELDQGPLCSLRRESRSMVSSKILAFLCGLLARWPLDGSLMGVLELWLAYIHPWRYTITAVKHKTVRSHSYSPAIWPHFDNFVKDNLCVYTHIFSVLLVLLKRLDFKVYFNVIMLYRLTSMLTQHGLVERLQRYESLLPANGWQQHGDQWTHTTRLFSQPMLRGIEEFLYEVCMSHNSVVVDIATLRDGIAERKLSEGFLRHFFIKLIRGFSEEELTLQDTSRTLKILRLSIDIFCQSFRVDQASLRIYETVRVIRCGSASATRQNFSFFDSNGLLDTSNINPHQMSLNVSLMQPTIDPAMLPIQSNEVTWLVRMLHRVSTIINNICGRQIEALYARNDYYGKVAQQLLYAPMTEQWFDKGTGNVELREKYVPARVCLRPLGSIPVLVIIASAMILAKLVFGSFSFGMIILGAVLLGYVLLMARYS